MDRSVSLKLAQLMDLIYLLTYSSLVLGDTPAARFFDNVVTATQLSIPITTIPGRHFPYVTHVEAFVDYVVQTTRKYD